VTEVSAQASKKTNKQTKETGFEVLIVVITERVQSVTPH
jgi:hypothetical protein